jgi:hypothetical protein
LINSNTATYQPFFLTAFHCMSGFKSPSSQATSNVENWVFEFNYESGGTAPVSYYGATIQKTYYEADGLLLLLNQMPQDNYFNGWQNSFSSSPLYVGIHHPRGDSKKISFSSSQAGATIIQAGGWDYGAYTVSVDWDRAPRAWGGLLEPGSSGSPLFEQSKKIIGVASAVTDTLCNIPQTAYYGDLYRWFIAAPSNQNIGSSINPNNSLSAMNGVYPLKTNLAPYYGSLPVGTTRTFVADVSRGVPGYSIVWTMVYSNGQSLVVGYGSTVTISGASGVRELYFTATDASGKSLASNWVTLFGGFGGFGASAQNTLPNLTATTTNQQRFVSTNNAGLQVYPNPIQEQSTIAFSLDEDAQVEVRLVSLQGNVVQVLSSPMIKKQGTHTLTINKPQGIANGTYLIQVLRNNTIHQSSSIQFLQ